MNSHNLIRVWLILILAAVAYGSGIVRADRPGWQQKQVDWRMTGGTRIKAVNCPEGKPPLMLAERDELQSKQPRKEIRYPKTTVQLEPSTQKLTTPIIAIVFDSPPIDGLASWVAVSITDARAGEFEVDAVPATEVTGNYLTPNPQADYAIGFFDTGASTNLIGYAEAVQAGLYDAGLVTSQTIEIIGVAGSAIAWVSHPLGLFVDGLGAIEPNGFLIDDCNMVGETNVSIIVGDPIESPNMPTAIGAPLAAFFAADFNNTQPITLTRDSNEFTAPDIRFYGLSEPNIPDYSGKINLQLRPTDADYVQYFPCIELIMECPDGDGSPFFPTIIVDAWWQHQALFFASSVDLTHGDKTAYDKDGFMFDTGAQVTVISEAITARLQLDPADPDFEVEIMGASGNTIIAPGFYIDSFEIVATPEWLSFTNVPVIMLDVDSPEGGYLDGVIGMNLFTDLNFVFHGGGLPGQSAPFVKFEPIYRITGDIAPPGGDGVVDYRDLAAFVKAWQATPTSPNWNSKADLLGDGKINCLDFTILANHWLESTTP
jgi:hypothetical protein